MLNRLFPHICVLCHHNSFNKHDLCETCHLNLPLISLGCNHCAIPLPSEHTSLTCGHCLKTPPPFDTIYALYHYEQPITRLIRDLKFNHTLIYAALLGQLLLKKVQSSWYHTHPLPDILLPMPLHSTRLKERGFNQALEITRPLARALNIPIDTHISQRIKPTLPQTSLEAEARHQNIQGAFCVTQSISQKHIAIIDDVVTTGNTVSELSRTLKQAGARKIDIWCIARS